ncbi:hypothetical protein AAHA92_16762 [Salvia divinorum]|uniref:Uncharacterized protein n=1 Tax=Salvia divinorum TaxID=28513 RepID=A0ABD1H003_SALDI
MFESICCNQVDTPRCLLQYPPPPPVSASSRQPPHLTLLESDFEFKNGREEEGGCYVGSPCVSSWNRILLCREEDKETT